MESRGDHMEKYDIIIVGGGASGVFLSLLLKDHGKDVCILEAKDRILKKLLTTGNGRCNITNENVMNEIEDRYSSSNKHYDFSPLKTYPLTETVPYFNSLGLQLKTLEDHKMYPLSLQASSVVDTLRLSLEEKGIPVHLQAKVKIIRKQKGLFHLATENMEFECKTLVISTGGMSAPSTGSDGSIFKLLKALKHNIIPPMPALVQLNLDAPYLRALSGVKLDGTASLYMDGELVRMEQGELLFTEYGISGPPTLQISRFIYPYILEGKKLHLRLNFFPDKTEEELKDLLLNQLALLSHRTCQDALRSLLPGKLIPVLLKESGIQKPSTLVYEVDPKHFLTLIRLLQSWDFQVTGTQGFNTAQGTFGGVDTQDVKETLESKIVPGLYFTGEVLDVLGACGGYNLQWAWSTAGTVMKALTNQL